MKGDFSCSNLNYLNVQINLEWKKEKGFRFLKLKAWLVNLFFSPFIVAKVKEGSK